MFIILFSLMTSSIVLKNLFELSPSVWMLFIWNRIDFISFYLHSVEIPFFFLSTASDYHASTSQLHKQVYWEMCSLSLVSFILCFFLPLVISFIIFWLIFLFFLLISLIKKENMAYHTYSFLFRWRHYVNRNMFLLEHVVTWVEVHEMVI